VVATRDGVLVVRHENELSTTTDVASRLDFASRYRSQFIDGEVVTGWFTEDFTWAELSTLHCTEPMPIVRPVSANYVGSPVLRLAEVLAIADAAPRPLTVVVELKHATHFASKGLILEDMLADELEAAGWGRSDPRLTLESFELTVLLSCRERGIGARRVYLLDESGTAADQLAQYGPEAPSYELQREPESIRDLSLFVDGISIPVGLVMSYEGEGLIRRCHDQGLVVYTWTVRAENKFLPGAYREGVDPRAFGRWEDFVDAVLATKVDGVFTDQPDLVRSRL
jgi:glycerophosphoryl diester phosphodiesterase